MITEAKTFTPRKDKIIVKPIMRARNPLITDPEHEAFFLVGSATISYCLPVDRQGNLINPFESEEEKKWLEEELDLDLNIHKSKDNFWTRFKVKLGKVNKTINLANPKEYLEYLVLKANKLYIAPDGNSTRNKATYRYALVSEGFETKKQAKEADLEIDAYMALGSLKEDKQEMLDFLKVYGKKVSPASKSDFLVGELKNIIQTDIKKFLDLYHDKENYKLRLLIADGVEVGAIMKDRRKYHLPGGDPLCAPGDSPTIENALKYLKDASNQDILTTIKARVENAKD